MFTLMATIFVCLIGSVAIGDMNFTSAEPPPQRLDLRVEPMPKEVRQEWDIHHKGPPQSKAHKTEHPIITQSMCLLLVEIFPALVLVMQKALKFGLLQSVII
jgi:hypothetical protein